jgi:hypothetical protein
VRVDYLSALLVRDDVSLACDAILETRVLWTKRVLAREQSLSGVVPETILRKSAQPELSPCERERMAPDGFRRHEGELTTPEG